MIWTAIVPINYGRECKTRLSLRLSVSQRTHLVDMMARHVLAQLQTHPDIGAICVVSAIRPPFSTDIWIEDKGRGLNAELSAARDIFASAPVAFIHGDLPFLDQSDLDTLLDAAANAKCAIAPDRAREGTNALAICDGRAFLPAFGPGSFAKHRAILKDAAIVDASGLAFDIDDAKGLDFALAQGLAIPYA